MAVHAPRTPKHVQKRTASYTTRTLHSRYHTLLSLIALALHVMWYTGHYFVYRPVVLDSVRVYEPTQHARRTPRVYCTQQWSAGANERRTQGCRTHTRAHAVHRQLAYKKRTIGMQTFGLSRSSA